MRGSGRRLGVRLAHHAGRCGLCQRFPVADVSSSVQQHEGDASRDGHLRPRP